MNSQPATRSALLATAALLIGCTASPVKPAIPEMLKAPSTQTLSLNAQAAGMQIYECRASASAATGFEWIFKSPEANLFDSAGRTIGKHYAGPTWESMDGSKVVGAMMAKDNGPDVNAIPWLLLTAKSTSGNGIFNRVLSIQRLYTVGGKAPADGCGQAQAGNEVRVPYKASYYFYVAKP